MSARVVVAVAMMLALSAPAGAQPRATANANAAAGGGDSVPNALQGFQQNRGQPVHIEAARLEVRDKDKLATFAGNVKVVQGDTTLRAKLLTVHYDGTKDDGKPAPAAKPGAPGSPMQAAAPGPNGSSQISRLEAKGNVIVSQKDQTATGDSGIFDMKSNTVTLLNNVVVSQGKNVLRGERLVVDLTTGVSKVDAGENKGPVRMMIINGVPQKDGDKGAGSGASSSSSSPLRGLPQR